MSADMFMGLPIVVSEAAEPGKALVIRARRNGESEQTVVMHPTLVYAFRLVRDDPSRHTSDPSVMIEASTRWQRDRIERAASRALGRMELVMLQQDMARMQREQDAELAVKLQRAVTFTHRGLRHRWTRDTLRRTATCHGCSMSITEEQAARLGVRLPMPQVHDLTASIREHLEESYRSNQRWLDMMEDDTEVGEPGSTIQFPMRREDGAR